MAALGKTMSRFGIVCLILTAVFIILRLSGLTHWGWIWILAPIWMPLVSCILFILVIIITIVSQKRKRLGIDE